MKSVLAASMHKAGSTICDDILTDFFLEKGLNIDRISLSVPASPLPEGEVYKNYQSNMVLNNTYYGVARGVYVADMPILSKIKLIIQVRDPRDCITSAYFSFKTSHVSPKDPKKLAEFLERRKKLQSMEIDKYALSEVYRYITRMNVLRGLVESHNDALVLHYEEMVTNTDAWLEKISNFVDQPVTDQLLSRLGDKVNFSVDKEDENNHKRQVTPGDHKRKLKPETIEEMTERLKENLDYFEYRK